MTPAAAPPESRVIVSGFAFLPNITVKIYFDGTEPPLATVTSDGAGAFSTPVVIPDGAGADHTICARTPDGDICASFRLQPRPSPSPVALPSPSTGAPSPSALPPTGAPPTPVADAGTSPVAFIAKPPFVFFPILLVAGLVGWLAYYLWGQRPSGRIQNVTVVHRAPVNRDYEQPPITPESPPVLDGGPPATEPNPTQPPPPAPPPVPETPSAPEPPAAPSSADVPPDLPGSDSDD